ncbi:unnamed protein product [Rotaria sp. Silwood1]|nr:unnamed protein product [Rotaria sp. Silwood1]
MCDCLQDLLTHNGPDTKAIIWAHNSHIGDARETDSRRARQVNIGQLIRERFGIGNTFNIGFTTYTGTVTAADNWDMDPDFKRIRPSLSESVEFLLHEALTKDSTMRNDGQYFLLFRSNNSSINLSKELHNELHKKLPDPEHEDDEQDIERDSEEEQVPIHVGENILNPSLFKDVYNRF